MRKAGTVLKKVKPTTSLFFGSMPCEVATAALRNKAVKCMDKNNSDKVALRYLQNRKGRMKETIRIPLLFFGICLGLFLMWKTHISNSESDICNINEEGDAIRSDFFLELSYFFMAICCIIMPPALSNFFRYRETEKACIEWLIGCLGQMDFQKVENLPYIGTNLPEIKKLLGSEKIDASEAEESPEYRPRARSASI